MMEKAPMGKSNEKGKRKEEQEAAHCFDCNQICCRTAVVEVESPRSLRDYSDLLFYLYHFDTEVVVATNGRKRDWFVEFMSPCRHLVDGRCSIYEYRPLVCREYEMESCEFNMQKNFTYIRTPEEFFEYLGETGKGKILGKLEATHRAPAGAARQPVPEAAAGSRTRLKRPF